MINNNSGRNNIIHPYCSPTEDFIKTETEKLFEIVKSFCKISNIDTNRIHYNIPTIRDIIIRIDMRQMYFDIFHDRMDMNEYKRNNGLMIFWIIKLHPFWIDIKEGDSAELIKQAANINEQIALHIAISLLREYNPRFFKRGKDLVQAYCNELLYSFRYRDLSKESLFLMFDPFYYMHLYENTTDDNGKFKL